MSDPVDRVLAKLESVHQNGQGWIARCPAHDDHEPSLKIDEGDDRVLLHCHAGCSPEAIVGAMGLTLADLFERRNGGSPRPPAITLAQLARTKRLPPEWVAQTLGWYDLPGGGVGLPYRDETGNTLHVKRRTALKAKDGSYWPKGIALMPYGLEALSLAREAGYLLLVEGESDTATLRYHGLPVLGIPGADSIKVLQAEHLHALSTVYAWQEPDKAGATFVQSLAVRFAKLGYQGQAKVIHLEGIKDASDLHVRNPEGFKAAMQQAMETAEDLERGAAGQRSIPMEGGDHDVSPIPMRSWPQMEKSALIGLAGEFVRVIEPHTEADPVALLIEFLVAYGNVIGRRPHCTAEADYHAFNRMPCSWGIPRRGARGAPGGTYTACANELMRYGPMSVFNQGCRRVKGSYGLSAMAQRMLLKRG